MMKRNQPIFEGLVAFHHVYSRFILYRFLIDNYAFAANAIPVISHIVVDDM